MKYIVALSLFDFRAPHIVSHNLLQINQFFRREISLCHWALEPEITALYTHIACLLITQSSYHNRRQKLDTHSEWNIKWNSWMCVVQLLCMWFNPPQLILFCGYKSQMCQNQSLSLTTQINICCPAVVLKLVSNSLIMFYVRSLYTKPQNVQFAIPTIVY